MNVNKRPKIPIIRYDQYQGSRKESETSPLTEQSCHGYALDTLPPEVLEMILRLLPLHDVATSVRLVSRHCSTVAAAVLNGAFLMACAKVDGIIKRNENVMKKNATSRHLEIPLTLPLRPPPASTYSGYGEYGGRFFYYGNMNKYAYESKFMQTVNTTNLTVETEQQVQRPPSFDLIIEVELKCTPDLAPLAVRSILRSDEFETYEMKVCRNQQLYLQMNVTCPASIANRLPGNFVWELHSPRRVLMVEDV